MNYYCNRYGAALTACIALMLLPAAARAASSVDDATSGEAEVSKLKDITISYQLDPRLTRGLHMGDRWVSPPSYVRVGEVDQKALVVEARVRGLDHEGKVVDIRPEFATDNPQMLSVEPSKQRKVKGGEDPKAKAAQYTITVLRAGQGALRIATGEFAKVLLVKAVDKGTTLQIEISQLKPQTEERQP
jgi:hypothetical protein